jgi:hypothetical protein
MEKWLFNVRSFDMNIVLGFLFIYMRSYTYNIDEYMNVELNIDFIK